MIRRTASLALLVVTLVLAACGATPSASRAAAPRAVPAATTPGPTAVAALATDQGCTRRAAAGSVLQRLPLRADDLAAMTLPKSALGSGVSRYDTEWLDYGYVDNLEMTKMQLGPKNLCALNRTYGRIVGFSRAFSAPNSQTVWTAVHAFFTSADAAAWLRGYATGMKSVAGTRGVRSVSVSSMSSTLGTGAVRLTVTCTKSCVATHLLFRRGTVVGSVLDQRSPSARNVIDVNGTAKKLSARIAARAAAAAARTSEPVDAVMQLSAGLPKAALGTRYAGLTWDWFYGGCWDVAEAATQTSSDAAAKAYRAQGAKYGQLAYCRAMYWGANGPVNGVDRLFTGGTLYATAAGAHGAISQTLADWRAKAGRTVDGTRYGPVTTFSVGSLGDERLGLQQKSGSMVVTRVLIRHGRYVAVAAMNARAFSGMTADVKRWAAALDARAVALLSTRRV